MALEWVVEQTRKLYPKLKTGSRSSRAAFATQAVVLAQECPSIRFILKQALYDLLCLPTFQVESPPIESSKSKAASSKSNPRSSRKSTARPQSSSAVVQTPTIDLPPSFKDCLLKARFKLQQTWLELRDSRASIGADLDLNTAPSNKCTCAFPENDDSDEEEDDEPEDQQAGAKGDAQSRPARSAGEGASVKDAGQPAGDVQVDGEDEGSDDDEEDDTRAAARKQRMRAVWFEVISSHPSKTALEGLGNFQPPKSSHKNSRSSSVSSRGRGPPSIDYGALSSLPSWEKKSIDEVGLFDIMLGLKLLVSAEWSELECQHCSQQRIKRWEKKAANIWQNVDDLFGVEPEDESEDDEDDEDQEDEGRFSHD